METWTVGSHEATTAVLQQLYRTTAAAQLAFFFYCYFYHHFYFPAQLEGGSTLSDLLDKPWSRVSYLSPLRYVPSFLSRIAVSITAVLQQYYSSTTAIEHLL